MDKDKIFTSGSHSYKITEKEERLPEIKRCAVFQGQGYSSSTMLKNMTSRRGKELLKIADDMITEKLEYGLYDYIAEKIPRSYKYITLIKNIALFVYQVARFKKYAERHKIDIITSHSFGVFASYVCSGLVRFEDMLKVVFHREKLCCDHEKSGYMMAVIGERDKIDEVRHKYEEYVANVNSANQLTLSISEKRLDEIKSHLMDEGVRYKDLSNVPQPYHSALMKDVQECWNKENEKIDFDFGNVRYPYLSNRKKYILSKHDKEAFLRDIKKQLITSVDFRGLIEKTYSENARHYVEIGPKGVCSQFIESILKDRYKTIEILDIEDSDINIDDKNSLRKNGFLTKVLSKIARLTGYDIESISIEDRFQEDLGLDSIKKADIVFEIIKEENLDDNDVNIGDIQRIKDTKVFSEERKDIRPWYMKGDFEIFKKSLMPYNLKKIFSRDKERKIEEFSEIISEDILSGKIKGNPHKMNDKIMIDCRKKTVEKQGHDIYRDYQTFIESEFNNLIEFAKNIARKPECEVLLLSEDKADHISESLASVLRNLHKENTKIDVSIVRLEDEDSLIYFEENFSDIISDPKDEIYISKEGNISCSEMIEEDVKENEASFFRFDGKKIAVIGGMGGLGFSILSRLSEEHRDMDILIIGRRRKENDEIEAKITQLNATGNSVSYKSVDAKDEDVLKSALDKFGQHIDLILNFSGRYELSDIKNIDKNKASEELDDRMRILFNLLKVNKNRSALLINSGSIIGTYLFPRQMVYSLGNKMLEMLPAEIEDNMINIFWPGWYDVGMVKDRTLMNMKNKTMLLDEKQGYEIFKKVVRKTSTSNIFVLDKREKGLRELNSCFDNRLSFIGDITDKIDLDLEDSLEKRYISEGLSLENHRIDGKSHIPTSYLIAKQILLGIFIIGSRFAIHNFKFKRAISLAKETFLSTSISFKGDNYRITHKTTIVNASSEMADCKDKKDQDIKLETDMENIDTASCYEKINKNTRLNLEGGFIILEDVQIGSNTIRSHIRNDHIRRFTDRRSIDKMINIIESSIQLIVIQLLEKKGCLYLPKEIGSLYFDVNLAHDDLEVISEIKRDVDKVDKIDNICQGNLVVKDVKGRHVLEIRDWRFIEYK